MEVAYLAMGSNLGDRERYFRQAIRCLRDQGVDVVRAASVYETEPKDVTDQPWFLNTVLEVQTDLEPRQLLDVCLSIEAQHQRQRSIAKSARTLDLDILFYGNRIVHEAGLTIPHPRLTQRNFVLIPLAELAPEFVDPVTSATMGQLLTRSGDPGLVRRIVSGEELLNSSL